MGRARRLTTEAVRKLQAAGKTKTYTDPALPGLYLRVNRKSKTWICQRTTNGRQERRTLGRFPELTAEAAREKALRTLAEMGSRGAPSRVTLREAIERHLKAKALAPRTREDYERLMKSHLAGLLDRPLRELGEDRSAVRALHEKLARDVGRRRADYAMQLLRAAYRRARREHPDLPAPPTEVVEFKGYVPRKIETSGEKLRAWGAAVVTLSPVRRDLHLFMFLTGMRRTAACTARAEHFDEEGGKLRVPNPKGGAARAFDLPLSEPLLDLIRHRIAENEKLKRGTPWLFPSLTSETGHATETKEAALGGLSGHALRHAYTSQALEAGVPFAELKLLLNHKFRDVTFGYAHLGLAHLRKCQGVASAAILAAVGLRWTAGSWPPSWEAKQ